MNRPPRDISPADFFVDWLPAELAKTEALGSAERLDPVTVQVHLTGDDGGTWALHLDGGKLTVSSGAADNPRVALTQSVADWRTIVVGDDGPIDLAPPSAAPTDFLFVDPEAQKLLDQIKGQVTLEVANYNGRTWMLTISFAAANEPAATISVEAETYAKILSGEIAGPQAFMGGQITFGGDTALAMQVGMAMMSRMQ